MVAVPLAIAVTSPVEAFTLAIVGSLLAQIPPETVLVSVEISPAHSNVVPEIAPGTGLTVIVVPTAPHAVLYDIFDVPAPTANTWPVEVVIEATLPVILLQLPPGVGSVSVTEGAIMP